MARTTTVRQGRSAQGYRGLRLLLGIVLMVFGSMLLTTAIGRELGDPVPWIATVVTLGLAVFLVVGWLRVRRRLDFAELHRLPPGSPAWGDLSPDHAPLPHWQPWR